MASTSQAWRPVVTAFVQDAQGRVLVVKRSHKVRTYQGFWGGVSGGVEGEESLLERALAELQEETGLSRQQLHLLRCGRPLPVEDGLRRFLVYPFLFQLLLPSSWPQEELGGVPPPQPQQQTHPPPSQHLQPQPQAQPQQAQQAQQQQQLRVQAQPPGMPAGGDGGGAQAQACDSRALRMLVRLNWENSGYQWLLPSEVPQLQHVPLLPETLQRLLLPSYMQLHVDYLLADRTHGAAELAAYVLSAFGQVERHEAAHQAEPPQQNLGWQEWLQLYRDFAWHMAMSRPSMVAIANAAAEVMLQLEEELLARAEPFEPSPGVLRVALGDAVRKVTARLTRAREDCARYTAALVPPGRPVLLLSYSSTVGRALAMAAANATAAAAASGRSGVTAAAGAGRSKAASFGGGDSGGGGEGAGAGCGEELLSPAPPPLAAATAAAADGVAAAAGGGAGPQVSAIVLESRPLLEGVRMARRLCAAGVATTVVTDAQAGVFARACGALILGADAITPSGVVNKVGSYLAALAASAAGVPVYAVADSLKLSPGPLPALALPHTSLGEGGEEKGGEEVRDGWPPELRSPLSPADVPGGGGDGGGGVGVGGAPGAEFLPVRNVYFEEVPYELLAGVVTEQGVVGVEAVRAQVAARGGRWERAFQLASHLPLRPLGDEDYVDCAPGG